MMIERLLATAANDADLVEFTAETALYANPIERRDMTVIYTVPSGSFCDFRDAAIRCGITLQLRMDSEPFWKLISRGKAPPWKWVPIPSRSRKKKGKPSC